MVGKIKTIIITGGCGSLGVNLATELLKNDFKVITFDNLSSSFSDTNILKHKNYTFIHGDIRIKNDLKKLEGDLLIHTAEPDDYRDIIDGGLNIIEYCQNNKIPLILISSNKIYSNLINKIPATELPSRLVLGRETGEYTKKGKPVIKSKVYENGIDETFPIDGLDLYFRSLIGASKYTGDLFTQEYNHLGLGSVIIRLSFTYGKYQYTDWLSKLMIARLIGREVVIEGTGKEVTDALFFEDFSELILLILNRFNEFKGKTFNIGGGFEPSFTISKLEALGLIDVLDQRSGYNNKPSKITYQQTMPYEHNIYLTDLSKISPYWKPKTVVFSGFEKKYNWLHDNLELIKEKY